MLIHEVNPLCPAHTCYLPSITILSRTQIGGAAQLLAVLERILDSGRAPPTLGGIITTFASSLLSACASSTLATNCSCTRTLEGDYLMIEARRDTQVGHEVNAKFPTGEVILPSATLPEHFSQIPGLTFVGVSPSSCVDV